MFICELLHDFSRTSIKKSCVQCATSSKNPFMGSIKAKELSKLGYTNDQTRSLVINIISKYFKHHNKDVLFELLTNIKNDPSAYVQDAIVGKIAETFIKKEEITLFKSYSLLTETGQLKVYGGREIEGSAKRQMELAMALPVS